VEPENDTGKREDNKKMEKIPARKAVTIKFGDVMICVEGETQSEAKKDALEIFDMLEEKYNKHWEPKVCRERTKFD